MNRGDNTMCGCGIIHHFLSNNHALLPTSPQLSARLQDSELRAIIGTSSETEWHHDQSTFGRNSLDKARDHGFSLANQRRPQAPRTSATTRSIQLRLQSIAGEND
ncbi:63e9f6da-d1bb-44a8-8c8c-9abb1a81ef3f-CDS [Sclerotinia trifoliorum]|uniref:63e9f6da-d1bb-44a8-8c8c-9abb1a81ef3f-CDS n=1 Tax=Sclerotinia trifoliorum TaxID=28548 RepID=A0A8H2ZLL1_9HELO|nr:63e9f6da-d1bb-44a8-8c8c-9abb1a81ef3f-CDS [Sclerotinia trifoliorum]